MRGIWSSLPNFLVNHTNLKGLWIIMSYVLIIIFVTKFWSSGKIYLTKDPLGKTLVLYIRGFLLLFLRIKILHQVESNVKRTILESSIVTYG